MTAVKSVFIGGIILSGAIVAIAAIGNTPKVYLLTLPIALIHILGLVVLCWKLPPGEVQLGVETLHKAGFLQTLISLAAAIAKTSGIIASSTFSASSILEILAPMAASVIPHALGVTFGHLLSTKYFLASAALEESLFRNLIEDAEEARNIIKTLYSERETSLRKQVEVIDKQRILLGEMMKSASAGLTAAMASVKRLEDTTKSVSDTLISGFESMNTIVTGVNTTANSVKKELELAAISARDCSAAFRDTAQVARDVRALHESIVALVEQQTFKGKEI